MSKIIIKTVAEFHERLYELKKDNNLFYRGQSNAEWQVNCSAFRRLNHKSIEPDLATPLVIGYLQSLIDRLKMRGLADEENPKNLELLAKLQHQGAATGLIDFTRNPLIALWFACNENKEKDGAVHILSSSQTKEINNQNLEEEIEDFYNNHGDSNPWLWEPSARGNRTVAQSSIFVFGVVSIQPNRMDRFLVDKDSKTQIIEELQYTYGIDEESLFSDFSGYAVANSLNKTFDIERSVNYWKEKIDSANNDVEKARAHFHCGVAYYAVKNSTDAINQFSKTIELKPDYADAYYNRGGCYAKKGEYDKAIADYNEAINLKPDYAATYNNRGGCYAEKGEYDKAIADCNKVINLKPDYVEAYYNRGGCYAKKGEYDKAIADCNEAINLKPDYAEAYYNRGGCYAEKGEYDKAIADYNKAIKLKPDYYLVYYNRAISFLHLQEFGKAKEDFTTAKDKGLDIVNLFNNEYGSVADFESKTSIKLPADIKEMLAKKS